MRTEQNRIRVALRPRHPTGLFLRILRSFPILGVLAAGVLLPHSADCLTLATGPVQEYVFLEGYRHHNSGNLKNAERVWTPIFRDDLYGPVAYVLLAQDYENKGDLDKAASLLKDLMKNHLNGVYRDKARAMLVDVLCKIKSREALPLLTSMIDKASENDKPHLLFLLAALNRHLGKHADAARYYRELFVQYPASVEGLKAAEDLAWMVVHGKIPRPTFSDQEQRARASRLSSKGRFDLAADSYRYLLKRNPDDADLMLKLATCLFKGRHNKAAIATLKSLLSKKNISNRDRMEALYVKSRVYWRLQQTKEFERCCNTIIDKGSPRLRQKALFNLAVNSYERERFSEALARFNRLLTMPISQSVKADVTWKMAWTQYRRGKYAKAAEMFRQARVLSPGRRISSPSRYWQARSLLHLKRSTEAKALLKQIAHSVPLDYYGQESARVLRALGSPVKWVPNQRSFPRVDLTPSQSADTRVKGACKLMEADLYEFALMNLEALPESMKRSPAIVFLRAKAAYGAEQYKKARDILYTAFGSLMDYPPEDAPAEFIEMAFPRVHRKATVRSAKRHGVDPHLVWAIVRQESLYDASAVSPAGALGLMQVTPKAAGVAGKRGRIPPSAIAKILEPEHNLAVGTRILSKNLSTFKGKIVPAVASYNADIRKVRGWVRHNGKMAQDEFIDNIPYLETRLYVKKVLAGYRAYSMLHKKTDLAGLW